MQVSPVNGQLPTPRTAQASAAATPPAWRRGPTVATNVAQRDSSAPTGARRAVVTTVDADKAGVRNKATVAPAAVKVPAKAGLTPGNNKDGGILTPIVNICFDVIGWGMNFAVKQIFAARESREERRELAMQQAQAHRHPARPPAHGPAPRARHKDMGAADS